MASDDDNNPTQRFVRISKAICRAHQCSCDIKIEHENIPLVNDEKMAAFAKQTTAEVFGSIDVIDPGRYITSEDFSEYTSRVPSVFILLGCADPEKKTDIPLHNPSFNIDEYVLMKDAELHVKGALTFLTQSVKE